MRVTSWYLTTHFQRSHGGYKGDFDEFFDRFLTGRTPSGSWFRHVSEWTQNRAGIKRLILHYEDLKSDLEGTVRRIADFCEVPLTSSKLALTLELSSFKVMKQHEEKFDFIHEVLRERGFVFGSFIREGTVDAWKSHLSKEQELLFHRAMSQFPTLVSR